MNNVIIPETQNQHKEVLPNEPFCEYYTQPHCSHEIHDSAADNVEQQGDTEVLKVTVGKAAL